MDNQNRGHGAIRHPPSECLVCRIEADIKRWRKLVRDTIGLGVMLVRIKWQGITRGYGGRDEGQGSEDGGDSEGMPPS